MSESKRTPEQIKALADQFICHPASRSIDEIEIAGEIMHELLKQRDKLLAICDRIKPHSSYLPGDVDDADSEAA